MKILFRLLQSTRGERRAVMFVLFFSAWFCSASVYASDSVGYHFRPIDKEFDRIALQLYTLDLRNQRERADGRLVASLDDIARRRGNKQLVDSRRQPMNTTMPASTTNWPETMSVWATT